MTEQEHVDALSQREFDEDEAGFEHPESFENAEIKLSPDEIAKLISREANDIVIVSEVSSRKRYEQRYKNPIWPGLHSGVTVGIGYDLGYENKNDFPNIWNDLVSNDVLQRLSVAVGVRGKSAKNLISQLGDIVIPWDVALQVYKRTTMPKYAKLVLGAFPNARELHPHSFGALFSLVYNRGASLSSNPRRQEMRNIRDHMIGRNFEKIPDEFRSMKRLWEHTKYRGLVKRREVEARLFEKGLEELQKMQAGAGVPNFTDVDDQIFDEQLEAGSPREIFGFHEEESLEEEEILAEEDGTTELSQQEDVLEHHQSWNSVRWAEDDRSPDYKHIKEYSLNNQTFDLTSKDLDLLIEANSFVPTIKNGRIVFALRGCELVTDHGAAKVMPSQIDRTALTLRDTRPDHSNFKCVIGVYNITTKRLSGFISSTVPTRKAVLGYKEHQRSGNMMATGCYRFTVYWHLASKPNSRVPSCLTEHGKQKAVYRSINNLEYDVEDIWENHRLHGDNLHPSFGRTASAKFSSLGCLVVRGSYRPKGRANGKHIGEWAKFRKELGLDDRGTRDHKKIFDVVLLTGLEAAIASRLRTEGLQQDPETVNPLLLRLRQGSQGKHVRRLEQLLGERETGIFGPKVAKALADYQKDKLGWATGVYSQDMDGLLGWDVFSSQYEGVGFESSGKNEDIISEFELEALYYDIGLRTKISKNHPEASYLETLPYDQSVLLENSFADLVDYGKRIIYHIEKSFYSLMCGDSHEDQQDRDQIREWLDVALTRGVDAIELAVASILSKLLLPVPPSIINQAARIIVRRLIVNGIIEPVSKDIAKLVEPKVDKICINWSTNLRQQRNH